MPTLSTPSSHARAAIRRPVPAAQFHLLFLLLLGLCIALPSPAAAVEQDLRARVEQLTQSLTGLGEAYLHAGDSARDHALSELVATAAARHDQMVALMSRDPATVLEAVFPADLRARLPAAARPYIEQWMELDGRLEVFYEDHRDGSALLLHYLESNGERLSLHFKADPPGLLSGTSVRAKGVVLDDQMALESESSVLTLAARGGKGGGSNGGTPAPSPTALGEQTTLLILVNFVDDPTEPYTVADARSMLFGTTSDFYLENSQGQTWLNGDVAGWFTIASTSDVCNTSTIADQAQQAAVAAGYNPDAYLHVVYAFPLNRTCGWWGLSSVGGVPSQTWISGDFELGVTGHELGHAMGLFHSHALDCGSTTLGANCTTYEYGDMMDLMGSSAFAHFNAFQKERLGWLNAANSPPIQIVQTDGTHLIEAYESTGSGPKALKILKSTDSATGQKTWYYVQARQAIGFDSGLADNGNVMGGVLILTGTESNGNSSNLLDMTPESGSSIYWDWIDPALVAGQSFSDAQSGVTITTEWVTGTEAAVTVQFGGGFSTPPVVAVSTDQSSYTLNQRIDISAEVTSEGVPLSGAQVSFTITKSDGSVVSGSATTGSDGVATYSLRLRRQDPIGAYVVAAVAAADGMSAAASGTFSVQ